MERDRLAETRSSTESHVGPWDHGTPVNSEQAACQQPARRPRASLAPTARPAKRRHSRPQYSRRFARGSSITWRLPPRHGPLVPGVIGSRHYGAAARTHRRPDSLTVKTRGVAHLNGSALRGARTIHGFYSQRAIEQRREPLEPRASYSLTCLDSRASDAVQSKGRIAAALLTPTMRACDYGVRCRQRRAPMPARPRPSKVSEAGSGTAGASTSEMRICRRSVNPPAKS